MTVTWGSDVAWCERREEECIASAEKLKRAAAKARALVADIRTMAANIHMPTECNWALDDFANHLDDLVTNCLDHQAGLMQEEAEENSAKLEINT